MITRMGIIFGVVFGISTGVSLSFFGRLRPILGIIIGLASIIYTTILISKIDKSNSYPYWKQEKNENNK